MKKVILITGASSGIGLACAKQLHADGHIVYGSSRNANRLIAFPFKAVSLDVTDEASVKKAYANIIRSEGRLDVLINNAGIGISGPAYASNMDGVKRQMETNFFGLVRMSNAVLPNMITRGRGLIINISSLAGLFGLPYQSMYCASKHAIEGYSESLRMELRRTGVRVVVINPGDYASNFTASREKLPFTLNQPYLEANYIAALASMERTELAAPRPERAARKISSIIRKQKPAHRYLVGTLEQIIVPTLRRLIPRRMFDGIINDYYGVK